MSDASRFTKQKDQSFRTFLGELERRGELIRFLKPVDPLRNMSAVEWKTYNELGKSSLFTAIEGYPGWTACSQIVADRRKWAAALGVPEGEVVATLNERIGRFIDPVLVRTLAEDAPRRIRDLIALGVPFDEEREGYKLIKSDFGSHARALGAIDFIAKPCAPEKIKKYLDLTRWYQLSDWCASVI